VTRIVKKLRVKFSALLHPVKGKCTLPKHVVCSQFQLKILLVLKELQISYFDTVLQHCTEAPRYKPEGRGFDYRWRHWNFSLT
jgi:hypothetical protein